MKALHIRFEGFTASFRYPMLRTGTQASTPTPGYSNLLGMIGACAGREVGPEETRVGFEYRCRSTGNTELERTVRWKMGPRGLIPHPEGQGITYRQFHVSPQLDLYLTNRNLRSIFEGPVVTPCFGRSQDIAWIRFVHEIELFPVETGDIGPTLLPGIQTGIPGIPVRLAEYFHNNRLGYTRQPGPIGLFQAITPLGGLRYEVRLSNLFHPSDANDTEDAIYLHEWSVDT